MSISAIDAMPLLEKYPDEDNTFFMDFTNKLRGEVITAIVSVAVSSRNLVSGSSAVTIANSAYTNRKISFQVDGGTAGEEYVITAKVSTATDSPIVGQGRLKVKDYV